MLLEHKCVLYVHVGLAHVCVVTESMTLTRARIEVNIPRKRRGSCENHDKVSNTTNSRSGCIHCMWLENINEKIDHKMAKGCVVHSMYEYNYIGHSLHVVTSVVELSTVVQALKRFYDTVIQAVIRHVRFDGNRDLLLMCVYRQHNGYLFVYTVIKCLLVASPGFVKVSCLYKGMYVLVNIFASIAGWVLWIFICWGCQEWQ